jgi:hypothetical protein
MIVPAAHVALARSLAAGLAGPAGQGMWTTGLSATGAAPATHFISAGQIAYEFAYLMTSAEALYGAAMEAGLEVEFDAIEAMLAASLIREDADPHAVIDELGLKIVSEDIAP